MSIDPYFINFGNEFEIGSSLYSVPLNKNTFINFTPNNDKILFLNQNTIEIYVKENIKWEKKFTRPLRLNVDSSKIKGVDLSKNGNFYLVYYNQDEKGYIYVFNLVESSWSCKLEFIGNVGYACFHPDSFHIMYIKTAINTLNIFSLCDENPNKYEFKMLKFTDKRSVNFLEYNNNIYTIVSCYGIINKNSQKKNSVQRAALYKVKDLKNYIAIILNKKIYNFFEINCDVNIIMPLNYKNQSPYFIVIETDKHLNFNTKFIVFNINGDVIFNSENKKDKIYYLNPMISQNSNFILAQQQDKDSLEIFTFNSTFKNENNFYSFNYKNLVNEKRLKTDNFYKIDDIIFLNEKNDEVNSLIDSKLNDNNNNVKKNRKLFIVENGLEEFDFSGIKEKCLFHAEISPEEQLIAFYNKNCPKYLFLGRTYQSGVFKIIKFLDDILCFKWNTKKDLLLVLLNTSTFYLISKKSYINFDMGKTHQNRHYNDISWSPSGQEVILSNDSNNKLFLHFLN